MSHLDWPIPTGFGQAALASHAYNQVVRVDNILHISGQGGWDQTTLHLTPSAPAQIDQAFANVEHVLRAAGGKGWSQVFKVRSYHLRLDSEAQEAMVRNFQTWMPGHKALWTCVQVGRLGSDEMEVEIEVEAHDPRPEGVKELDA
ncbi:uncharacterized protein DSM5745_10715 [Aspergillus mulundensis]|uniref:Uncharacterized protein n=1 Tax=Aspergillus mulundensis TaxID=1810919 RepID=A0A3D8QHK0_9EURO|nr:hypothetical protein DSM5745_10715 [Aspergillus mulundensis]RDW61217.1 hypothetical protein DSM5745_10715 [Aspergillus mulundensis]